MLFILFSNVAAKLLGRVLSLIKFENKQPVSNRHSTVIWRKYNVPGPSPCELPDCLARYCVPKLHLLKGMVPVGVFPVLAIGCFVGAFTAALTYFLGGRCRASLCCSAPPGP